MNLSKELPELAVSIIKEHGTVVKDTDKDGNQATYYNLPHWFKEVNGEIYLCSVNEIPNGVKLCDCPECGAEIQFGISSEVVNLFKDSKLFSKGVIK